ncbi:MAG: 50S ribosomal protein L18 [Deltaproteobacteria bacterium]|nr:50S ribosomal protein L18 [Deltaproteobacteria bacterium]
MAISTQVKAEGRLRRKKRIRARVEGNPERPRMSVFRSLKHIYVQVVDDAAGKTLVTASTLSKEIRDEVKSLKKTERAKKVGGLVARLCAEKKIGKVVFDRNGYLYHGRVKALATAAREAGLKF